MVAASGKRGLGDISGFQIMSHFKIKRKFNTTVKDLTLIKIFSLRNCKMFQNNPITFLSFHLLKRQKMLE